MDKKTIVVVGTGYVGLPAALMWAKSGMQVIGVDINENIVKAINERTILLNEEELNSLLADTDVQNNLTASATPCEGDVFVIAVPTPINKLKKVADLSCVESAILSICPFLKRGNLVIIESTVPPMTCRQMIKELIERNTPLKVPEDIFLSHCPERIIPGDIFFEIVHNDRLIGGIDKKSTDLAIEIYRTFVKGELLPTDDLTAEMAKLLENTYRDINIAFANEFKAICDDLDLEVENVIKLANRHPRVNVLRPGIGVGGHCIPVDPWFLKEIAPYNSRLITVARMINDEMPERIAAKIRKKVSRLVNPKILLLGATYKRNCEDIRESPAIHIAKILCEEGYNIEHYDPLVPGMGSTALDKTILNSDFVAVLVSHDLIKQEVERIQSICQGLPEIVFFD